MTSPRFRTLRASLTTLSLTAAVLAAVACSSAPDSDPATAKAGEAVTVCQSVGFDSKVHPECGGFAPKLPVAPTYQTCQADLCSEVFATKTTPGYDPIYIPTDDAGDNYTTDPAFTAMLTAAGCGIEHTFSTGQSWVWGTAICPISLSTSTTAYGAEHDSVAGTIPCDACTGDPTIEQFVVSWLINPGVSGPCASADRTEFCPKPGAGCKTVSCMGTNY